MTPGRPRNPKGVERCRRGSSSGSPRPGGDPRRSTSRAPCRKPDGSRDWVGPPAAGFRNESAQRWKCYVRSCVATRGSASILPRWVRARQALRLRTPRRNSLPSSTGGGSPAPGHNEPPDPNGGPGGLAQADDVICQTSARLNHSSSKPSWPVGLRTCTSSQPRPPIIATMRCQSNGSRLLSSSSSVSSRTEHAPAVVVCADGKERVREGRQASGPFLSARNVVHHGGDSDHVERCRCACVARAARISAHPDVY
jgi:hypothetical protein